MCLYMTGIVSITACLAHAPKKCTQSGNCHFDLKSPSDPTRLLCQIQANAYGAEFLSTISKFMKRMNFVIACLRPSQNVKLGIFTGSRVVDGKQMYKSVMHVQSCCVSLSSYYLFDFLIAAASNCDP